MRLQTRRHKCLKDLMVHYSLLGKHGLIYLQRIISGNSWLVSCFALFFCIGCFMSLPTEIEATATYYDNCEMYLTGTLIYRGSSTGYDPVDNLNGRTFKIYLNGEAERTLATNPYLTNLCSQQVEGWIEAGYQCSIPYSDRLLQS